MTEVGVVRVDEVDPVELGGGSKSWVLIDSATTPPTRTTLGYSEFGPGTSTQHMSHAVEELAFVVAGSGILQLDDRAVPIGPHGACHIPAGLWHTVVNESPDLPLVMVFAFASPTYPPTERRPSAGSAEVTR